MREPEDRPERSTAQPGGAEPLAFGDDRDPTRRRPGRHHLAEIVMRVDEVDAALTDHASQPGHDQRHPDGPHGVPAERTDPHGWVREIVPGGSPLVEDRDVMARRIRGVADQLDQLALAPADREARYHVEDPQGRPPQSRTTFERRPRVTPRVSTTSGACRTTSAKSTVEWAVSTTTASCSASRIGESAFERSVRPPSAIEGTNGSWYAIVAPSRGQALQHDQRGRLADVVDVRLVRDADPQHLRAAHRLAVVVQGLRDALRDEAGHLRVDLLRVLDEVRAGDPSAAPRATTGTRGRSRCNGRPRRGRARTA